ncbi:hypothetical protein P1P68_08770 [Streptomyces scabiei]|uniref:peptidoglycan-binding domain-containing protein n=1 Tax=Streptomyces scabiei TaxID=1930 RepID=UPI00298F59C6|nr:hypothetical protein [Streptomyces scabiei]MDW8804875.1 hypothetical protein [Streptomyces scabiei]
MGQRTHLRGPTSPWQRAGLGADGVVGPNTWAKPVDWSGRDTYCTPPRPAGYPIDGLDTAKYQVNDGT